MQFKSLQLLRDVAETGSFVSAAMKNHTVQSNVTAHIKKLEKELGAQLIDRKGGVTLTSAGEVVLDYAQKMLQSHDELLGLFSQQKNKTVLGRVSKADVALSKIRKLYTIEEKIASMEASEKKHQRQVHSKPVLDELKARLDTNLPKQEPGSLIHTAMQYASNQWPRLIEYCNSGYLKISNVGAENAIRPFTVGRKN